MGLHILDVTSPDVNNGTGFRATLWVAGCSHKCKGCHNQHTWDYNQGVLYNDIKDKLFERLRKPYIKGLTISGGDPLSQNNEALNDLRQILFEIKAEFPNKDIWIYAGDTYEEIQKDPVKTSIIDLCDVLVDGTYNFRLRNTSLAFRGSSNQRVIDLNETRKTKNITLLLE